MGADEKRKNDAFSERFIIKRAEGGQSWGSTWRILEKIRALKGPNAKIRVGGQIRKGEILRLLQTHTGAPGDQKSLEASKGGA